MSVESIITDYDTHQEAIRLVRDQVFVIEQRVDRSEEYDDRDSRCTHVVVFDGGAAVATGRIDLEKNGKIGRVAVLESHRGRGIGSLIMEELERIALQAGAHRVWFHAQVQAIPFYEKLGYRSCSNEFMEANIPHVQMEKSLQDLPD